MSWQNQVLFGVVVATVLGMGAASIHYIQIRENELNDTVEHLTASTSDDFVWGAQQFRIDLARTRHHITAYGDAHRTWDSAQARVATDILYSRFETIMFAVSGRNNHQSEKLAGRAMFRDLRIAYNELDGKLTNFIQAQMPQDYPLVLTAIDRVGVLVSEFANEILQSNQVHAHDLRVEMLARAGDYKNSLRQMLIGGVLLMGLIGFFSWRIYVVNQRLKQAVYRAEYAAQAKSQFLSSMSHEFRTPLNAISGYTQLILMNLSNEERDKFSSYSDAIDQSIENLVELVDQVLVLDNLLHRNERLILDQVDARLMVKNAIKMSARYSLSKRITVHQDLSAQNCILETDSGMFTQALSCLVSNAIKFNHDNGSVWVSCKRQGDDIELSVKDNGIGIPKGKESLLFRPFERLGRESGSVNGSGTGLSICQQICKRLGIELRYERVPGGGSLFLLRAPRQFVPKPKIEMKLSAPTLQLAASSGKNTHIH